MISMAMVIAYLTFCSYLPDMSGVERSPLCLEGPTLLKFVNYFAWFVFGGWLAVKMLFHAAVYYRASHSQLNGAMEDYLPKI